MPRQTGPVYITGTIDGICYYKMDGEYLYRRKSSLSRKRVKKDPAFALTRVYADLMAQASRLASAVYRQLPKARKGVALFHAMTGEALLLLKQGVSVDVIHEKLQVRCGLTTAVVAENGLSVEAAPVKNTGGASSREINEHCTAAPLKTICTTPARYPVRQQCTRKATASIRQRGTQKIVVSARHLSANNIHIALPANARMYITPEGRLEVRLTNKRTKAAYRPGARE
ncbi:MAG TPA: hypothetical protein VFS25_15230 [Chitinophaga sp.]|uniref:hypothetical protein n=1 Tax=Chitinophaga sp. TaxID=1869181 RepID=UPI002DBC1EF0|nr:hypothetical protein [Chitinophaga sp.]HEU4554196.1 hypothetical protein [Chitinophaga sp.]